MRWHTIKWQRSISWLKERTYWLRWWQHGFDDEVVNEGLSDITDVIALVESSLHNFAQVHFEDALCVRKTFLHVMQFGLATTCFEIWKRVWVHNEILLYHEWGNASKWLCAFGGKGLHKHFCVHVRVNVCVKVCVCNYWFICNRPRDCMRNNVCSL